MKHKMETAINTLLCKRRILYELLLIIPGRCKYNRAHPAHLHIGVRDCPFADTHGVFSQNRHSLHPRGSEIN